MMLEESYMKNNDLQLKLLRDPKFYLENFCKIKGKKPGSLLPFVLKECQKDLFNTLRVNNRVMILKARQLGFSSAMVGYFYHNTIMNPGTNTAIIGYNSQLVTELLDKVKTFHRTTPEELRPTIEYNSKYEMSFPAMDSKIIVLPSTEYVGRGYTLHNVLVTELSFWDKADEKMSILEASVPIDGKIVIESTPNQIGDRYHRMWMDDNNGYIKKSYGYHWGYTDDEINLIRRRLNDPKKFAREYLLQFMSSGRPVFDQNVILESRKNILGENDVVEVGDGKKHIVSMEDGFRIYKPIDPGGLYIFGVDTSEGMEDGDYSVIIVWDRKTGEEVALYRGLVPPDRLADKLDVWGRRYNNALMVVEVNNHGLTTLTCLRQKLYPNLYFRPSKFETMGQPVSDRLGWKTNKVTRPLLIDELAKALRDGEIIIHSKELLDEMTTMVYNDNGDMVSQRGYHDDCIFAAGIGLQGFKVMYDKELTQIDYSKHLPSSFSY